MEKRIKLLRRLKLVAFIVLIFSVFLPFSSCTRTWDKSKYVDVHPEKRPPLEERAVTDYETGETVTREVHVVKKIRWVFSDPKPAHPQFWLFLLSFLWPIFLPLLYRVDFFKKRAGRQAGIEFLAASLAAVNIWWECFLSTPEIGAWASFFANIAIGLIVVTEAGIRFFSKEASETQGS